MPRVRPAPARCAAALVPLLGAVLLVAACSGGPGTDAPAGSASAPAPAASPTAAPLTYEQAVAALLPDLVPAADVVACEDPGTSTPQPRRGAGTGGAGAAAGPGACGVEDVDDVEAVRAASLAGFAHGPSDPVSLPVTGGASRVVEVYELVDGPAAAAAYADRVADRDRWAVDQEVAAQELPGGLYQPRRVVTGAAVESVDLPGWTTTVLSRDEASFRQDGSPASDPTSYAHLWALRDAVLVRVQVAGDEPGSAAATAVATAQAYVAAVDGAGATGG